VPKQIQTPTFGQALVQKFGLKGRYQPVLDETIVPVSVVSSPELSRWAAGGSNGTVAAVVGENFFINLTNPSSSLYDLVVVGVSIYSTQQDARFSLMPFSVVGATIVASAVGWRDSALSGVPVGLILTGSQATGSLPSSYHYEMAITATTGLVVGRELYTARVAPGKEFTVFGRSANSAVSYVSLSWEEELRSATRA